MDTIHLTPIALAVMLALSPSNATPIIDVDTGESGSIGDAEHIIDRGEIITIDDDTDYGIKIIRGDYDNVASGDDVGSIKFINNGEISVTGRGVLLSIEEGSSANNIEFINNHKFSGNRGALIFELNNAVGNILFENHREWESSFFSLRADKIEIHNSGIMDIGQLELSENTNDFIFRNEKDAVFSLDRSSIYLNADEDILVDINNSGKIESRGLWEFTGGGDSGDLIFNLKNSGEITIIDGYFDTAFRDDGSNKIVSINNSGKIVTERGVYIDVWNNSNNNNDSSIINSGEIRTPFIEGRFDKNDFKLLNSESGIIQDFAQLKIWSREADLLIENRGDIVFDTVDPTLLPSADHQIELTTVQGSAHFLNEGNLFYKHDNQEDLTIYIKEDYDYHQPDPNNATNGTFTNSGEIHLYGDKDNLNDASEPIVQLTDWDHVGKELTIDANLDGGGTFHLGGHLVNDGSGNIDKMASKVDQLIINGDVSGRHNINLILSTMSYDAVNGGGIISAGDDFFTLVTVNPETSLSLGREHFQLVGGYVDLGHYEYYLVHNGAAADGENKWYLSSENLHNIDTDPETGNPIRPDAGGNGGGGITPTPPPQPGGILSTTIGAYAAAQNNAVEMFQHSSTTRMGNDGVVQSAHDRLFWIRSEYRDNRYNGTNGNFRSKNETFLLHAGADLTQIATDTGVLHLGAMAGFGETKNKTTHRRGGIGQTDIKTQGFMIGGYATWFENGDVRDGLYLDTWAQFGHYRNTVTRHGGGLGKSKYNSRVRSLSGEVGYGVTLFHGDSYRWNLTPQAQLTYNNFNASQKNHYQDGKNSGVNMRLGARFQGISDDGMGVEPYLDLNYRHVSSDSEVKLSNRTYKADAPKNRFNAALGIEGKVTEQLSLGAHVGGEWGKNSYSEYKGGIKLNYRW